MNFYSIINRKNFEKVVDKFKDKNVELVLISVDYPEDYERLASFVKARGYKVKVYWLDEQETSVIQSKIDSGFEGVIPASIFINKATKYRTFHSGQLTESTLMSDAIHKEKLFRKHLVHPLIKEVRGEGLMLAAITDSLDITTKVILKCQERGLILFWLLFEGCAIRITPPLTISETEIEVGCQIMLQVMDEIVKEI